MKKMYSILVVLSMLVSAFQGMYITASEKNMTSVYEGNGGGC